MYSVLYIESTGRVDPHHMTFTLIRPFMLRPDNLQGKKKKRANIFPACSSLSVDSISPWCFSSFTRLRQLLDRHDRLRT